MVGFASMCHRIAVAANLPAREISVKGGRERGEGACTPLHRGYWADFGKQYGVGKLSDGWKMNAHECAGTRANPASVEEKIKKKIGDLRVISHRKPSLGKFTTGSAIPIPSHTFDTCTLYFS